MLDWLNSSSKKLFGALTSDIERKHRPMMDFDPPDSTAQTVISADEAVKKLIISAKSLDDVWQFITQRIRSGSEPQFMVLSSVNEMMHAIQPRFLTLPHAVCALEFQEVSLHDTANHMVQTVFRKDTTFSDSIDSLGGWFNNHVEVIQAALSPKCAIFTVPLIAADQTIATITIGFGELDTMTQAKLSYVYAMRDNLAQLVWNLLLKEQLDQQVYRDPLTSLLGFQGFHQQLTRYQQDAREYKTPLTLINVDFCDLLAYNNAYGLENGDKAFIGLVRCIEQIVGASAVLARIGDDNIGVICPNMNREQAIQLSKHIELEFELYDHEGPPAQCSCTHITWPDDVPAMHLMLTELKKQDFVFYADVDEVEAEAAEQSPVEQTTVPVERVPSV